MGYRAVLKNGKPLSVPYKTGEAIAFQKLFKRYLYAAVEEQGWDKPESDNQHFYIDAVFYFPRKRMDCNNYWKVLLDTITDTQLIWKDDDVVCERAQAIYFDKDNPRIELTIHPVEYIGVFNNASHLEEFESKCIVCGRYARNCKILQRAKEGRIQCEIVDGQCSNFKQKSNTSVVDEEKENDDNG